MSIRSRHVWIAAALTVILAYGLFIFLKPDPIQQCCDRIEIGMSYEDAIAIVDEFDLKLTGGDCNLREAVYVFQGRFDTSAVVIVTDMNDVVVTKEIDRDAGSPSRLGRAGWLQIKRISTGGAALVLSVRCW